MGGRQLALTLGALMLCVFLAALDSSIVANALPRIIADLQGFELYAWVTTGYLLSSTAVTPLYEMGVELQTSGATSATVFLDSVRW